MSMNISRRQFLLGMLGASAVGTLALKLLTTDEVVTLDAEFITHDDIRFISTAASDGESWVAYIHPSVEDDLRNLPPAEMVEADAYASRPVLHRGEIRRINSMMKFRRTEVLPPFERPVPLQVFRGAQWKHEQRPPYHTRFA